MSLSESGERSGKVFGSGAYVGPPENLQWAARFGNQSAGFILPDAESALQAVVEELIHGVVQVRNYGGQRNALMSQYALNVCVRSM